MGRSRRNLISNLEAFQKMLTQNQEKLETTTHIVSLKMVYQRIKSLIVLLPKNKLRWRVASRMMTSMDQEAIQSLGLKEKIYRKKSLDREVLVIPRV